MRAYLKSEMPCLGVNLPVIRQVVRSVVAEHPLDDRDEWQRAIRDLWDNAEYREERHAALAIAAHRSATTWARDPSSLDLYRYLIVTGAWWDLVDEVAHRIADLLHAAPADTRSAMLVWSTDPDRWLRRVSIICQVGAKDFTDLDLLIRCIDANLDDRDFFLRKAIGWALRDLAKTNPEWVRQFVAERDDRLSALSRREALKHLVPA